MNAPRGWLIALVACVVGLPFVFAQQVPPLKPASGNPIRNARVESLRDGLIDDTSVSVKPWKTSKVVGTPEPPPPFRAEVVYPDVRFKNPVVIVTAPGSDRWFVGQQDGHIFSFSKQRGTKTSEPFLNVRDIIPPSKTANTKPSINNAPVKNLEALYGLTFHPKFAENRFVYVCYVVGGEGGKQLPDGTRVSRFKVSDTNPPHAIPDSEEVVISWLQGGHNGGCLCFGPDGCLYISTGDGGFANPPDGRNSGQDMTTLLSKVLRIDVDHPDEGKLYSIPKDNPFANLAGARGETWCYGLRNPWKMKFDRQTGELWVGDVGWELWELVFNVKKGANYGWSVVEGRQQVHPDRKVGPSPIVPPTIEVPHTDGVSITGGYVYRGQKFPELVGQYLFGDWETRRIWGSKWDDATQSMTPMKDLVEPTVRLVDFAEDHDGELVLLDYDNGQITELVRNPPADPNQKFPTKLSETGLFSFLGTPSTEGDQATLAVAHRHPAEGVTAFDINAEQWADGASAQRFIAVPSSDPIVLRPKQQHIEGSMFQSSMTFPAGTVLVKTLSLPEAIEASVGKQVLKGVRQRPIETQLLHYDGRFWRGYTYAWNDQQTDAELVEATGRERTYFAYDEAAPQKKRELTWHFSGRVECARCHNQWAEYALAFNLRQLDRETALSALRSRIANQPTAPRDLVSSQGANQLKFLARAGLVEIPDAASADPAQADRPKHLVNPYEPSNDINERARSYLHVNCAHCHRTGGGGSGYFQLQQDLPLDGMKAINVKPTQGVFEIADAQIIATGDPFRSTLFYRISKTGSGRMPHIGSELVDERGTKLIFDWIRQLPPNIEATLKLARLRDLDEETASARERQDEPQRVKLIAQQAANARRKATLKAAGQDDSATGNAEVTEDDLAQAKKQVEQQLKQAPERRKGERTKLITELLGSTRSAVQLAHAVQVGELTGATKMQVVDAAAARSEPQLRDLFEQFLPAERRVKRLGSIIRPPELLAMQGNADSGRELFTKTAGINCKNCHRVGEVGTPLGPELTAIAKRATKAQILDSILEPSKVVDPKYVSYVIVTDDGKVHTGLMTGRTEQEIILKTVKNEEVRIAASTVEEIATQRQSLMPELLLKDMTAQQVADLLEFLSSLK